MRTLKDPSSITEHIKGHDATLVLFGMSYCPFMARFRPHFDAYCKRTGKSSHALVVHLDDLNGPLWDEYDIEVSPTVLLFRNGKISKRFDGVHGRGLPPNILDALS